MADARKKSSRADAVRALSVMIHVATATMSSSFVLPWRPIQSSALKPIAGVAGSSTITFRPALRR
ncbi:hypothetical protein D3C87_1595660 [compost metagenome]